MAATTGVRWTRALSRRHLWLLTAAVALLTAAAITLPLWGQVREHDADSAVTDVRVAHIDLADAIQAAYFARSSARSFLASPGSTAIAGFEAGRRHFGVLVGRAADRSAGRDQLAGALSAVESAFERWLDEGALPAVELALEGNTEEAQAVFNSGGLERFDSFLATAQVAESAFADVELAVVAQREEARRLALILGFAGVVGGVSVGFIWLGMLSALRATRREANALASELIEQVRLAEQRQTALATVSHDLRNPLFALELGAELLVEGAHRHRDRDYEALAREVAQNAIRTINLATELMDFCRVESGRLELRLGPVVPRAFVDAALEDLAASHPGVGVEVADELPRDRAVLGDSARLRMVVRNLLENAVRYAAPPFRVRLMATPAGVEVRVADAGPGVPEPERERIFGLWERGSTAGSADGTGLGLYVGRSIAERHGGGLRVEDAPSGGATFVLSLPWHESA